MQRKTLLLGAIIATGIAHPAMSQPTFIDNSLVVRGSICSGAACDPNDPFDFDTLQLKSESPRIFFTDTSVSASFPTNDWSVGVDAGGGTPELDFRNEQSGTPILVLRPGSDGGVAIGEGATIEPGAISVGSSGAERRLVHVADGTDPSDAVTKRQLDDYLTSLESSYTIQLAADRQAVDARIDAVEEELDALVLRLNALESALGI